MYPEHGVKRGGNTPTESGSSLKKQAAKARGSKDAADLAGRVDWYAGVVYWLSHYMTGDAQEAEEVLQKTFLTFQPGLTNSTKNEAVLMRLARIAIDESFAKLRDRDASQLLRLGLEAEAGEACMPQEVAAWSDGVEKRYGREELETIVREGVQELTPFARVVFFLRDMAGLKPEQIADLFRLSVPRVKFHVQRSRLQLREHLNKHFKSSSEAKAWRA